MSKKVRIILETVALVLALAGCTCLVISMIREGSNPFLMIGLGCTTSGLLISRLVLRRKDDKDVKEK